MPVPGTHEGDHPEPSKRNYLLKTDGSGTGTTNNPVQGAIGVVLQADRARHQHRCGVSGSDRRTRVRPQIQNPTHPGVPRLGARGRPGKRPRDGWQQANKTPARESVLPAQKVSQPQGFVDPAKMECRSGQTCSQSASWSLSAAACG